MCSVEPPGTDFSVFLRRGHPAFLLLDSALRVAGADAEALDLLAEAYGDSARSATEMPDDLMTVIRAHCGDGASGRPLTVPVGRLLIHLRALQGPARHYLVSLERLAVRDHLKQARERYGLTRREAQVLSLILQGLRAKDIAAELRISPMTVRDHFTSLLRKSGSRNRSEMLSKVMNS